MRAIYRDPPTESVGLYPGLVVCDNRVTGSITVGRSRLPLWAFMPGALHSGFNHIADDYYGDKGYWELFDGGDAAAFLHHLFELRGEFGRLLLVMADAERCESVRFAGGGVQWWETKRHRKRVGDQLRRCLAALETAEPEAKR